MAVLLTVGVFATVGDHGTLTSVQRLDDGWLRLMASGRTLPLTVMAKAFNILGLYVTCRCGWPWPVSSPCDAGGGTWPVHRGRGGIEILIGC